MKKQVFLTVLVGILAIGITVGLSGCQKKKTVEETKTMQTKEKAKPKKVKQETKTSETTQTSEISETQVSVSQATSEGTTSTQTSIAERVSFDFSDLLGTWHSASGSQVIITDKGGILNVGGVSGFVIRKSMITATKDGNIVRQVPAVITGNEIRTSIGQAATPPAKIVIGNDKKSFTITTYNYPNVDISSGTWTLSENVEEMMHGATQKSVETYQK